MSRRRTSQYSWELLNSGDATPRNGFFMEQQTLHELYIHELQDVLSAEAQITKALPHVITAVSDEELQEAYEMHLTQTKEQVKMVKSILERHEDQAKAEHCKGMEGLLKECSGAIEDFEEGEVRDCALIAATQKVEHYEISAYGSIRAMANVLGYAEDAGDLTTLLHQESQADDKLSQISHRLNQMAVGATA